MLTNLADSPTVKMLYYYLVKHFDYILIPNHVSQLKTQSWVSSVNALPNASVPIIKIQTASVSIGFPNSTPHVLNFSDKIYIQTYFTFKFQTFEDELFVEVVVRGQE